MQGPEVLLRAKQLSYALDGYIRGLTDRRILINPDLHS